jgi:hypothetical protein
MDTERTFQKIDASGWVVLSNLIAPDEEIMIDDDSLFDRPVHAVVTNISSNNMLGIEILTKGARDARGDLWGKIPNGWLKVNWHGISVLKSPPTDAVISLRRIDNKPWMLQGPYEIQLEKETDEYYFGLPLDGHNNKRVWDKTEWGV